MNRNQNSHKTRGGVPCNNKVVLKFSNTWEGTFLGGSIRIEGSHSPGGNTVTWSRNSSMPATKSLRSLALYATSWKTCLKHINMCYTRHLKYPDLISIFSYSPKQLVSKKGKIFLDFGWMSCLIVFVIDSHIWWCRQTIHVLLFSEKSKAHLVAMMGTNSSS